MTALSDTERGQLRLAFDWDFIQVFAADGEGYQSESALFDDVAEAHSHTWRALTPGLKTLRVEDMQTALALLIRALT